MKSYADHLERTENAMLAARLSDRSPMNCLQCGTPVNPNGICPRCSPLTLVSIDRTVRFSEQEFDDLIVLHAAQSFLARPPFPEDPRYDAWLEQRRRSAALEQPIPCGIAVHLDTERRKIADRMRENMHFHLGSQFVSPICPRSFDHGAGDPNPLAP